MLVYYTARVAYLYALSRVGVPMDRFKGHSGYPEALPEEEKTRSYSLNAAGIAPAGRIGSIGDYGIGWG